MKSELKKFRQYETCSLDELLNRMKMDEESLYELIMQWIGQGYIEKKHPQLISLKQRRQEKHQTEIIKRQNIQLKKYQNMVDSGLSQSMIARQLSIRNMKYFLKKWVRIFNHRQVSYDDTAAQLRISKQQLMQIIKELEMDQAEKKAYRQLKIKKNQQHAANLLTAIQSDIAAGTNQFYIYDIEANQCPDEIIEIAIIDLQGNIIFNHLIKPQNKINKYVQALTGITNEMIQNQPDIFQIMPQLNKLTDKKILMSWGSDYDERVLHQTCKKTGVALNCRFECAQHLHMGLLNLSEQISLNKAAECLEQNHRALDDCFLVLKIINEDLKLKNR